MPLYRTQETGAFQARVKMAASYISGGRPASRSFDDCFEMGDGDYVVTALYRRTQVNPSTKMAANVWKYLCQESVEGAAKDFAHIPTNKLPEAARLHCIKKDEARDKFMEAHAAKQARIKAAKKTAEQGAKSMKTLSNYTEQATTDLLDLNGAFFAFSGQQLEEGSKDGVEYVAMGMGLICPKSNARAIYDGLERINKRGIELDMEENGAKDIIWRELANHECQITCNPDDAIQALTNYPITEEDIRAQWGDYWAHCVKNDYF